MGATKARLRYSISNIAWPETAEEEAIALVAELGLDGIEIAPFRIFGALSDVSEETVRLYRKQLQQCGLAIPAMQAILFPASEARLFGTQSEEEALYERLNRVADIAGWLGAGACVFGAPALRNPGDMTLSDAMNDAQRFFRAVAPLFAARNSALCFEANPEIYNCRFITHTLDALALVGAVGMRGFGLQFDSGTYFANDESHMVDGAVLSAARHFHVSEPNLVPIGSSGVDHAQLGATLLGSAYSGWISVEMRQTDNWKQAIRNSVQILEKHYGKRTAAGAFHG
ncbi:sugar phosphate isomerase/epimerase family protein [Brucella sp. ZJ1_1]|nr:TIM barrel protein [Brucella intermedia]ELT46398.1 xylose isomerase domain-containing protein [Brucella intermedia M86]MCB4917139.1 sugar phosphate isomerase/epimerase [Brucella intermedia]OOC49882.1 xylose isomerase [Brucella intermedia M86]SUB13585.1 Hydroxypyruvate isomerase [Brucella intermedia]